MNTTILKRSALAIGGAALLLGASVGFSSAQTAPTTPAAQTAAAARTQREAIINLAATQLGLTGDQLSQALKDARKSLGVKQSAVQPGKLARAELTVAARTLGYPDLKAMRKDLKGTALTDLAAKHNVPAATVAGAMKSDIDARIQALVTNNTIQANRAAALKVKG